MPTYKNISAWVRKNRGLKVHHAGWVAHCKAIHRGEGDPDLNQAGEPRSVKCPEGAIREAIFAAFDAIGAPDGVALRHIPVETPKEPEKPAKVEKPPKPETPAKTAPAPKPKGKKAKRKNAPVLRLSKTPLMARGHGATFRAEVAPLAKALGLDKLGCMLTVVPAGKRAFPFHVHHANDELFVILKGKGEYRYGEARVKVKAGDLCAAPAAGEAHQLINTGKRPLVYLGLSTRIDPEVVEYPDSGKFAALSVGAENDFRNARLRYVGRKESAVDYWDGED